MHQSLPSLPLLILDTETTGFVPKTHRVIEFAAVKCEHGTIVREYESLLSIPEPVPPFVEVLTRIKTEDLAGKPAFDAIRPAIEEMLTPDTIIVGQNIPFDIGMLKGEGLDLSARPWIDTSMLASIVFPELASYSLGYLSDVLKLPHEPKHRALGDVRATIALLVACYDRLCELPADAQDVLLGLSHRAPEGYRRFFNALPTASSTTSPSWLRMPAPERFPSQEHHKMAVATQSAGTVELLEEPLRPAALEEMLAALTKRKEETFFVAVKNLWSSSRRIALPEGVTILHPSYLRIDPQAVASFLAQPMFTEDEFTLATKLYLYDPETRWDVPLHGQEQNVWEGKIAASPETDTQLPADAHGVFLLDHHGLLSRLQHDALPADAHIIIDDASMLEDTATKAFGWSVSVPSLRAASEGNETLMRFTDLVTVWIERVRTGTDLRYLAPPDLSTREAAGLRTWLATAKPLVPLPVLPILDAFEKILDPANLAGRIAWIESYWNGDLVLSSVYEDIGSALKESLYDRYKTTLLIPRDSGKTLAAILPSHTQTSVLPPHAEAGAALPVVFPDQWDLDEWLLNRTGKSILLMGSKRVIEDLYVKKLIALEEKGITLFCQGSAGGVRRMQAQFEAAPAPAVLVLTPWMYEGIDLPPESIDELALLTLPFDHPSHAVIGRRALRYPDGFNDYSLPRLEHRLFRLIRTFFRHRTNDSRMIVVDDRLKTRKYGARVRGFLEQFAGDESRVTSDENVSPKGASPTARINKKRETKKDDTQPSLF